MTRFAVAAALTALSTCAISYANDRSVSCNGAISQSGLLVCSAPSLEAVRLANGVTIDADASGRVVIGLRQNEGTDFSFDTRFTGDEGFAGTVALDLAEREDDYRVIRGLECDKVDARTQEQKDHAGRSWVKKQAAFKTFHDGVGPFDGFIRPAKGRSSSPFGPTRKYIGVSKVTGQPCDRTSVHRGYDIAAPIGTPIIAPADGIVILADPDLYYEGGTVFLDHGYGLVSVFIHMSEIEVSAGDTIKTGEQIGKVGNTGRTTGPHLHWAIKWRNPSSEDRDGDFYIDPALLMEMDPTQLSQSETAPPTGG